MRVGWRGKAVVVLEALCAETGKRACENKDACVVQDFGGQRCVRCAARDKKWFKELNRECCG